MTTTLADDLATDPAAALRAPRPGDADPRAVARLSVVTMGVRVHVLTPQPLAVASEAALRAELARCDARFHPGRPGSRMHRVLSGRLDAGEVGPRVRAVLALAAGEQDGSGMPDARTVAAVALASTLERIGDLLDEAGLDDWHVAASGLVVQRGRDPRTGMAWTRRVVDPLRPGHVVDVDPGTGRTAVSTVLARPGADPVPSFDQVSVVGTSAVETLRTAWRVLDEGPSGLMLACADAQVCAIDHEGHVWATGAFSPAAG